jgi:hypothetical protein
MPLSLAGILKRWILGGPLWSWPWSVARLRQWWWARYLLTTRGYVRCRRGGLGRSVISWVVSVSAAASVLGGKARLVGDLAADGAVAADEG